jgi:hypothetical protein
MIANLHAVDLKRVWERNVKNKKKRYLCTDGGHNACYFGSYKANGCGYKANGCGQIGFKIPIVRASNIIC